MKIRNFTLLSILSLFLLFIVCFSFPFLLHAKKSYSVFSPMVGYSLSNTLKVSGSVAGLKYSKNVNTGGALVLGMESVTVFPVNDDYQWGLAFAISYEMSRSLEVSDSSGSDSSTSSAEDSNTNEKSKFSIWNIDFNGRFYFDEGIYFFGGIGFPQFTSDDKSWSRSGKLAWIGGMGWLFSEMIVLEVQYRPYRFSAEKNESGIKN